MRHKNITMVGDFETTVFDGQTFTEVWASALVPLYSEDVQIFHSLDDTMKYLRSLKTNVTIYYHNLKFDGSFWLDWLIRNGYRQAFDDLDGYSDQYFANAIELHPVQQKATNMPDKSFNYTISDRGQWYRMVIKTRKQIIELRDSMKLLPFSVRAIGKSFKTKHQKKDMEYKGIRYAGCEITPLEREYIANDVLVVKEALEIMFQQGHTDLTIGSCCLHEYQRLIGKDRYEALFPNMYDIRLDPDVYGSTNADEYIRKSYKGGWCYLVPGKRGKRYTAGLTADVNSLYPSVMSSESGAVYPIGLPVFWKGNYIPVEALSLRKFYFVRIRTRFYIKPNHLPFVQVKTSFEYLPTECLETSDIYNMFDGKYYKSWVSDDGTVHEAKIEMTLTMMDYKLLREHYDLVDCEILDGCYFDCISGLFDVYIDKYKKIKQESTGATRQLAKLFLNNLYGKLAASTNNSFKVCYVKDDGTLSFVPVESYDKKPGYIPAGSAVTSYARNFTIKAAQKNYHGPNLPGFIYADTDSIHCDLRPEDLVGVPVHPTAFCHWKIESCWDTGWYVRQKTYIEHVVQEDLEPCEPYWNIKCAGMPERCKRLFEASMTGEPPRGITNLEEDELEFIGERRTLEDFDIGLNVPGKLLPKRIRGGILLTSTVYSMRG